MWTPRLALCVVLTLASIGVFAGRGLDAQRAAADILKNTIAQSPADELATTIADGFTIASVGDMIIGFPASEQAGTEFQRAYDVIRAADVGYANMESSIIDVKRWKGASAGAFVGGPEIAADVKKLGFDIVARSNNHIGEYGLEGILETNRHLEEAGLVYAGSSDTYWGARAPRFLATPKGRVALVATTSTFTPAMVANPGRGEWPGRPGISALGLTRIFVAPPSMWDGVKRIRAGFPTGGGLYPPAGDTEDRIRILNQVFRRGTNEAPYYSYEMNERDLEDILAMVREGKVKSDFLAVAIHSHETEGAEAPDLDPVPGDFLPVFARACIDAGADAFFGTGVHVLRGIEIYKGRPIFYGLGEFVRQMDIVGPAAWGGTGQGGAHRGTVNSDPVKYESMIAVSRFDKGTLSEIRVYPTDLGHGDRMASRGVPRMASEEMARRTVNRLQRLSEPFGTQVVLEGSVGVIRPQPASTSAGAGR